jgi:hypothetical protein
MSAHRVTILACSLPLKFLEKLRTSGTSAATTNKVCVSFFSTRYFRNNCRSHEYLTSYTTKLMYDVYRLGGGTPCRPLKVKERLCLLPSSWWFFAWFIL